MSGIFGALVGQCQGVVHFQVLRLVSQCQVSSDFRKETNNNNNDNDNHRHY